jgi:hypothetical protein
MASSSVSPVNGNTNFDASQVAAMSNNQITSLLVSGNLDPKFVNLLLSQMSNNNVSSILFGNEDTTGGSSTGFDAFGAAGLVPNNLPSDSSFGGTDALSGSSANTSSVSPQFQLSVYSQLIGKTVTVVNPLNQQRVTDKVTSVELQNQQVVINVNGLIVSPSALVTIQK